VPLRKGTAIVLYSPGARELFPGSAWGQGIVHLVVNLLHMSMDVKATSADALYKY